LGITSIPISVNVSVAQLKYEAPSDNLLDIIRQYEIENNLLELEITESMLLDDEVSSIQFLNKVRAMGVSIALDDFGTGYSSLNYLCSLPINTLKIDRSFLCDIEFDKRPLAMLNAIMTMANALSLTTVSEGIETSEQLALVKGIGCSSAQGFYLSVPVSVDQATKMLSAEAII